MRKRRSAALGRLLVFPTALLAAVLIAGCGSPARPAEVVETAASSRTATTSTTPGVTRGIATAPPSGTPPMGIPAPTGTPSALLGVGQVAVIPAQEITLLSARRVSETVTLVVTLRNTDRTVPLKLFPVFFLMRDSAGQVVMADTAALHGALDRALPSGGTLAHQRLDFIFPRPIAPPLQFVYAPGVLYTVTEAELLPSAATTGTPGASTATPGGATGTATAGAPEQSATSTALPERAIETPGAGVILSPMERLQVPPERTFHLQQTGAILSHRLVLERVERGTGDAILAHFRIEDTSSRPLIEPPVNFIAIDGTGVLAVVDTNISRGLETALAPGAARDIVVGFRFDRPAVAPLRILHGEATAFALRESDLRRAEGTPGVTPASGTATPSSAGGG